MGGGCCCPIAVTGERCCRGGGGECPAVEGRIILWRPAVKPPIVFALVVDGLCNGPGWRHVLLVWVLWMSQPWVLQ
jgi:hypothetical protein